MMLSCFDSSAGFDPDELSPSLASVGNAAMKLVIVPTFPRSTTCINVGSRVRHPSVTSTVVDYCTSPFCPVCVEPEFSLLRTLQTGLTVARQPVSYT